MNKKNTTSFKRISTEMISTPSERSVLGEESSTSGNTQKYFIPIKRFTRRNNTSGEKSVNNNSRVTIVETQKPKNINPLTHAANKHQRSTTQMEDRQKSSSHVEEGLSNLNSVSYVRLNSLIKTNEHLQSFDSLKRRSLGGSFREQKLFLDGKAGPNTSRRNSFGRSNVLENSHRISQEKHGSKCDSSEKSKSLSIDSIQRSTVSKNKQNAVKKYLNSPNLAILQTELEIKEKQLQLALEDNRDLKASVDALKQKGKQAKKAMNLREQELLREIDDFRAMHQKSQSKCKENERKLKEKEEILIRIRKQMEASKKDLLVCRRDKEIAEKQVALFIEKRLPKNLRDLQTCREISLTMMIEELKERIEKSKTDQEIEMEAMIANLKKECLGMREQVRGLEIVNRLMEKKAADSDRYLEAYTAMKNDNKNAKNLLKEISDECEYLRKENIRMKKEIKKMITGGANHKTNLSINHLKQSLQLPSDTDSLNLSISAYSK